MAAKGKGGLGKGFNALFEEASKESGSNEGTAQNELAIDEITPNPNQPRTNFKEDDLADLADSIKREGLLEPILVRTKGAKYQIIAGERRYHACKQAGLKTVPVRIMEMDDEQALRVALIENLQRSDLNAIEEARGYDNLMKESGCTQAELAEAVSKSRSAIANSLRLLALPEKIQELIYEEKITAGHARAILSIPEEDKRMKLAEKIAVENLSVREAENVARLYAVGDLEKAKRPATPRSFKIVAKDLKRRFGVPVKVRSSRGKNKIEIEFENEDDLQRIYGIIKGNME